MDLEQIRECDTANLHSSICKTKSVASLERFPRIRCRQEKAWVIRLMQSGANPQANL